MTAPGGGEAARHGERAARRSPSGGASGEGRYGRALAGVTAGLGLPFGYTVTLWASGAYASHAFGPPGPGGVAAFVTGAVLAYLALGALEYTDLEPLQPLRTRRVVVLNAVPVVAAGLVALVDRTLDAALPGFFLSGAIATGGYVLLLAALWAWDEARRASG